jgi:hypothetical protein
VGVEVSGVRTAQSFLGEVVAFAAADLGVEDCEQSADEMWVNGVEKKLADIMPLGFTNPRLEFEKEKLPRKKAVSVFPSCETKCAARPH